MAQIPKCKMQNTLDPCHPDRVLTIYNPHGGRLAWNDVRIKVDYVAAMANQLNHHFKDVTAAHNIQFRGHSATFNCGTRARCPQQLMRSQCVTAIVAVASLEALLS